jgi:hypothetical protein
MAKKDQNVPGLAPDKLVELVRRGLNLGVPPTVLANMFDLPIEVTMNLSLTVRREVYGTAELSEVLSFLTWKAAEVSLNALTGGSPEAQIKTAHMIMGKALATSVRQTPEEVKRAREDLLAVARQERIMELEGEELEPEASSFVAVDEPTDD